MGHINEFPIVAEVQLVYHSSVRVADRPQVLKPVAAYELLKRTWNTGTFELFETFKLLLLSANKRVLGITTISCGGTMSTIVDPALVFGTALKANARSIILAHNHPSGSLKPSEADKALTQRLKKGGELLGIRVTDHIILSKEGYCSFQDERLL